MKNLLLIFISLLALGSCVVGDIQAPKDSSGAEVAPSLTSISPSGGPLTGGQVVTITGAGFSTGMSVAIGGATCTSILVSSTTSLSCTTGASIAGLYNLSVSSAKGKSATLSNAYTYAAAPIIGSFSPTVGSTNGGDLITITGSGFQSGATITIGGVTCSSPSVTSSTTMTCTSGANGAGATTGVVTNPDGQASGAGGSFTYNQAPTVSSISPNAGQISGGTQVTITGTNFTATPGVTLSGVICGSVIFDSATQIRCTPANAGTAQAGNVVVTNPDTLSATLINGYSYQGPPTITSITPNGGNPAGSTPVTIVGTGFDTTNSFTATIGGNPCTPISSPTTTSFTCNTPAGTGTVNLVVTNNDAESQAVTSTGAFTYQAAPTITTVSPNAGDLDGGTNITITGTGILTGATVTVGGTACTNIGGTPPTTITCDVPDLTVGAKDVVVTNPDNQLVTATNGYTYQAAPTVLSVSPTGGPLAGGTPVTITGTGFDTVNGVSSVTFGTYSCTGPTVTNSSTITCTTTGTSPGSTESITVTNNDGDSQFGTGASLYTYRNPPTVSAISPTAGALAGATSVTITGTGFVTGASVTIGGVTCSSVSVTNGTTLTCTTGAHAAGASDVVVTNTDTQSNATGNGLYTYQAAPTVLSISPPTGALSGGTPVVITGTGFLSGAAAKLGTLNCISLTVDSPTQISCTSTGLATAGDVNVTVTNADTQAGELTNGFKYRGPPIPISISPNGGDPTGGTLVTINGTDFDNTNGVTNVTIGTANCTPIINVTSTQLQCTTTAITAGNYSVFVTNNDGQVGTLSNGFTYQNPPNLVSITPIGGPTTGGTNITLTGTDFLTGAQVLIAGTPCTNVNVQSATTITCDTPSISVGPKQVQVVNPDQQLSSLTGGFTYDDPPTISSVSPNTGALAGSTSITILGSGFNPSIGITVGGQTCTLTSYNNDGSVSCDTGGPLSAGTYDIILTNTDSQTVTGTNLFTYQAAPTVTGVTPSIGSTAGGATITITGTNFDVTNGIAAVTVGTAPCTSVNLISSTSLTCVTTAQSAGSVTVTVQNSDGDLQSGSLNNGYNFFDPPNVVSVLPTNGPASGGTTITITGSGFINSTGTVVTVGGVNCSNVTYIDPNNISCDTGVTPAGTFDITVLNFDGQSHTGTSLYTFDPPPTISSITTFATGRLTGGNNVTIQGTNFVGTPTVTIGALACTPVVPGGSGSLTCTAPDGTGIGLGAKDVVLTNPDGQSVTETNGYTYVPAPTITSVSPSVISTGSATSITINGSDFIAGPSLAVAIDFGGTSDTCASPIVGTGGTTITCTAPAHAAGLVNVRVNNGDNSNATVSGNILNFVAPPTIISYDVTSGPVAGGGSIVITGTNFPDPPTPTVTIGGNLCVTPVVGGGGTTITCTIPAGTAGAQNVQIIAYSSLIVTDTGAYTYVLPPTVASVSPSAGPSTVGKSITITGTNFTGTPTVTVGAIACTGVIVGGAGTTITCTTGTPGPTAGASDIIVTNPDTQAATGSALYTYHPDPVVSSLSPSDGSELGVATTITGSNFYDTSTVDIGGSTCSSVVVVNTSTITCTTPAIAPGAYNVTVTSDGAASAALAGGWTSEAIPTFSGISPSSGNLNGGTTVEITGTNFTASPVVTFGATPGIVLGSPAPTTTSLFVTVPTGASTGAVDVTVTNTTGQSVSSTGAFTYTPNAAELSFQLGVADPNRPDPDDYGTGNANVSHTYTLKNVGSISTGNISVTIGGANPGAWFLPSPGSGDNCTNTTLAAGASCTIQVTFLGAIMPAATSFAATLNASDGSTSDSNIMTGATP